MTGVKRYNEGLNTVDYEFVSVEKTSLFTRYYINYTKESYYEKYDVLRSIAKLNLTGI